MAKDASAGRGNTRGRILEACRLLFNERGPTDVTTAQIAAAVGINEGNLYYHFQRKEQMLEALFDLFEQALRVVAAADLAYAGDAPRYRDYLGGWFGLIWDWRFFYRDAGRVSRLAPGLRPRLKALSDEGEAQIRRALEGMRAAGLMQATAEQTERLLVNAWIVSTYWIDYLRSRHGIADVKREHIDQGIRQVLELFVPYLTPRGLELTLPGRPDAA